jgi:hypothetical protein
LTKEYSSEVRMCGLGGPCVLVWTA